jgi:guanylate kinase
MEVDGKILRRSGCLFIVSGPSGAGKTSICTPALEKLGGIEASVSVTTRAPRGGERDGKEYRFVAGAVFDRMLEASEFAEWAFVHGHRYGTAKATVQSALGEGRDLLLDIDVQGAAQLKQSYPDAVSVFLLPPSRERLRERLVGRGTEDAEDVETRLQNACREIASLEGYDYVIVNEDLEVAREEFLSIVRAERRRTSRIAEADRARLVRAFDVES